MKKKITIKDQNGATVVEFALVLPLLVVFIFGIVEFSLLSYNKAMITNASREGARNGVIFRGDFKLDTQAALNNRVTQAVNSYCDNHLISFDANKSPTVLVDGDGNSNSDLAESGEDLTVTVTYDYQFLILPNLMQLLKGSLTHKIQLEAKTVMRFE